MFFLRRLKTLVIVLLWVDSLTLGVEFKMHIFTSKKTPRTRLILWSDAPPSVGDYGLWVAGLNTTLITSDVALHKVWLFHGLMKNMVPLLFGAQKITNVNMPVVTKWLGPHVLMMIKWCNLKYLFTKIVLHLLHAHYCGVLQWEQSQNFLIGPCNRTWSLAYYITVWEESENSAEPNFHIQVDFH